MTDRKAQAAAEADRLVEAAAGHPVSVKTRPTKTGELACAAPRALGLDGAALLERLPPERKWLAEITADNGFLNFHFSLLWYTVVMDDQPEPAPLWSLWVDLPPDCPAALSETDLRMLTALYGRTPHWSLAARQDRQNPAWLVRCTAKRLTALEGRGPDRTALTMEEQALLRRCADYPALRERPEKLARWMVDLARQVWAAGPLRLSEPVRRCVGRTLRAGLSAFASADLQNIHY